MSTITGQRQARDAAREAKAARMELAQQAQKDRERANREKVKAQRLMLRSLRAGAGGFFETDQPTGQTLGGGGTLG